MVLACKQHLNWRRLSIAKQKHKRTVSGLFRSAVSPLWRNHCTPKVPPQMTATLISVFEWLPHGYLVCFFINHLIGLSNYRIIMWLSIGFWLMKHQCFTYQNYRILQECHHFSADRGAGATFIAALFEGQSSTIVQCSQEGGWLVKQETRVDLWFEDCGWIPVFLHMFYHHFLWGSLFRGLPWKCLLCLGSKYECQETSKWWCHKSLVRDVSVATL